MSVSDSIIGIYGLFCRPSGKWYIGQSIDVHHRWYSDYKNLRCDSQPKLYRALKKYGFDSFDKVLIELCDPIDWILDYRETFWIRYYNSISDGYNLREGGKAGKMAEETKVKIAVARTGKSIPEHVRRKISEGNRRTQSSLEYKDKISKSWVSRRLIGISEETRQKMRNAKSHISEETRRKISEANRRRCQSLDTRLKISEARKLYWERKRLTKP